MSDRIRPNDRRFIADGGQLTGNRLTPLVRTHTPIGGVCSTNGLRYPRQKVVADAKVQLFFDHPTKKTHLKDAFSLNVKP